VLDERSLRSFLCDSRSRGFGSGSASGLLLRDPAGGFSFRSDPMLGLLGSSPSGGFFLSRLSRSFRFGGLPRSLLLSRPPHSLGFSRPPRSLLSRSSGRLLGFAPCGFLLTGEQLASLRFVRVDRVALGKRLPLVRKTLHYSPR
jgi:hypothetical protein